MSGAAERQGAAEYEAAGFEAVAAAALDGEAAAWDALVTRLQRLVWRTIGGFDLSAEDRKDAFAASFCRLYEKLDTIREPAKLPGWMATTARNEVLTLLRSRKRDIPTDEIELRLPPVEIDLAAELLDSELRGALRDALASLSQACQQLLRALTIDPPLSYGEISRLLDLPHGSIGPTRQRCLARLRASASLRPFLQEASR